jgi:hypothetical protein
LSERCMVGFEVDGVMEESMIRGKHTEVLFAFVTRDAKRGRQTQLSHKGNLFTNRGRLIVQMPWND